MASAGHVRIYQRNSNGNWEQLGADIDGEAADDYPRQRLLSADGSTVAIGASCNDGNGTDAGHVRIYQRNSTGNWEQLGADIDGEAACDESGYSVSSPLTAAPSPLAPCNDGNGTDSGHVRIYQRNSNGNWEQVGADIDGEAAGDYSGSASPSADGSTIVPLVHRNHGYGSDLRPCAHLSAQHQPAPGSNSALTSMEKPLAITPDQRLLSADGSTVAIGAP